MLGRAILGGLADAGAIFSGLSAAFVAVSAFALYVNALLDELPDFLGF